jgi:hypothetical protein
MLLLSCLNTLYCTVRYVCFLNAYNIYSCSSPYRKYPYYLNTFISVLEFSIGFVLLYPDIFPSPNTNPFLFKIIYFYSREFHAFVSYLWIDIHPLSHPCLSSWIFIIIQPGLSCFSVLPWIFIFAILIPRYYSISLLPYPIEIGLLVEKGPI